MTTHSEPAISVRMLKIKCMLVIALLSSVAQAATDPLLDKMVGTWLGEGERIQSISGNHTRIETRTEATFRGNELLSHNEVTETDASGQAKTYSRDYWIRPDPAQGGLYDFGIPSSDDQVTSQGHFGDDGLEVEQDLGGSPAYLVRSHTQFDAQGSFYEETTWSGSRQLSQTRIRYHHSIR